MFVRSAGSSVEFTTSISTDTFWRSRRRPNRVRHSPQHNPHDRRRRHWRRLGPFATGGTLEVPARTAILPALRRTVRISERRTAGRLKVPGER